MVYLHFPSNLTEEELMLQAKYQKLKRKKKALMKQKTPRPEPERSPVKVSKGSKMEARDAREVAKKLLKSGAISPIIKTPKRPENEGFKRPSRFRGLDRKPSEEKAVSSYQPFASSPIDDSEDVIKISSFSRVKNLYDNFVSEKMLEKNTEGEKSDFVKGDKPKQGNTIFVSGYQVTEEFLRNTFSSFGFIIDISMESEKNKGFVTFKKPESAKNAVKEMDGQLSSGNTLKVTIARRQFINPSSETMPRGDWRHIAGTLKQKGNYSDKREAVVYDDDFYEIDEVCDRNMD